MAAAVWEYVEIRPKPRSEENEEGISTPLSTHKSKRQKRQLKTVEVFEDVDEIEQKYPWRQMPVVHVQEARAGLRNDIFEETWAVFDKNGHPAHFHAFNLAQEPVKGKVVKIAFSSIAFEHWILLHFEKSINAFIKAECKDNEGRYLGCGTGLHTEDCWGKRCVAGYMRVNQYITCSTKKQNIEFQALLTTLASPTFRKRAYENAAWLRFMVPYDPDHPYLSNPYSNLDQLVKRLLGEENLSIQWASLEQIVEWQSLQIEVRLVALSINFTLRNIGSTTILLNGTDISISLQKDKGPMLFIFDMPSKAIFPGQEATSYVLAIPPDFTDSNFLRVNRGENTLLFQL